jgi:hypothetical protein
MDYTRLGSKVFDYTLLYANFADMGNESHIVVRGLSCGRVEFVKLSMMGRMTADEAEFLGTKLIEAAKAARAAREEIDSHRGD